MKERVIGAIALVAIAVLVVPVFLDGPSTDAEIISESVTLPGQDEQARKRQTIVLERDRDQPVPVSGSRNTQAMTPAEKLAADDAARKAAAAEKAAAEKVAAEERAAAEAAAGGKQQVAGATSPPADADKPEPAAANKPPAAKTTVAKADSAPAAKPAATESATGMWAVQLGSFSNEANAERLAADLRKNGYAAFLSQHKSSSGSLHRVRVGPQKDRESAEAVASKLGGDGHKGQVVPHP